MKRTCWLGLVSLLFACCDSEAPVLRQGVWRGVLELQDQHLPFNFSVQRDTSSGVTVAYIKNGSEHLKLDEIKTEGDSIVMRLHVFDAELRAAVEGDSLKGYYIKTYEVNYRIPFKARYDQSYRFFPPQENATASSFSGKYAVVFQNAADTTPAIGVFEQKAAGIIEGTFLTPTGDYRFLEGNTDGNKMMLSTFDGNHAYLFEAVKVNDSTLHGRFWSGKTWQQNWVATRNPSATLPDPESLTYLREGYDRITFSFPDVDGKMVSPTDARYEGKVLILQLSGTWCPNCMDETRFLSSWYKRNKHRDVEILGLAYETSDDFDYASSRVKKMKEKWDVPYDFVIAGTNDKEAASRTLPMLNRVIAFPTTIFIGRDGKVKKIHTGFAGPGTGIYFEREKEAFNQTINELLVDGVAMEAANHNVTQ